MSLVSFAGSNSTSTRQGGDKRKRRWREGWGGGRLFKGGDYFEYFHQRGTITRGTAIIRGNTVGHHQFNRSDVQIIELAR